MKSNMLLYITLIVLNYKKIYSKEEVKTNVFSKMFAENAEWCITITYTPNLVNEIYPLILEAVFQGLSQGLNQKTWVFIYLFLSHILEKICKELKNYNQSLSSIPPLPMPRKEQTLQLCAPHFFFIFFLPIWSPQTKYHTW